MDSEVLSLTLDSVNSVLKKSLCNDGFVVKMFVAHPTGDELLSFVGGHFILRVTYILDGKEQETQLFLKTSPKNDSRTRFKVNGLLEREVFIFNEVFSKYKEEEESKAWLPKCYLALGNDLVFEDLYAKGFKMHELRKYTDKVHAHVALKGIARMHSASLLLVDRKTKLNKHAYDLYEEFGKEIGESIFSDNQWFNSSSVEALNIAGHSEKYGRSTIYYNKIRGQWNTLYTRARNQLLPSKEYCNVVTHLDLWNNNILYRYDDSKPVQCMFLDYQCSLVCPPAADVVSFLYLNLDKKNREQYFDEFIMSYYEEVVLILDKNNIDVEHVLPWHSFVRSCQEFKLWALIESTILFQFIFLDENNDAGRLNNFDKLVYSEKRENMKIESDEGFGLRIMPILEELIETYIIQ